MTTVGKFHYEKNSRNDRHEFLFVDEDLYSAAACLIEELPEEDKYQSLVKWVNSCLEMSEERKSEQFSKENRVSLPQDASQSPTEGH